jgi:xanthine dehydrogenase molybdopterin-binding subunit B
MYRMNPDRDNIKNYSIWAVVVTEVEVDILTGEMRVVRVDLIEDAGLSTSPQVQKPLAAFFILKPATSTL